MARRQEGCNGKRQRAEQEIIAQGLTQAKAAKMMRLDQPKISALMRGKLKGFSTERLFRCLNDLGQLVEIIIRPVPRAGQRGDVHVIAGTRRA